MAKIIEDIMSDEFFVNNRNSITIPNNLAKASLKLSFALIEENPYEVLGYVLLSLTNVGDLQVAKSREEEREQLNPLQGLQGCQLLYIWSKTEKIKTQLIKCIPSRILKWNIEYNQNISFYYMDVVANNNVETIKIELDATDSFEYLENMCSKKTIIYCMLNV